MGKTKKIGKANLRTREKRIQAGDQLIFAFMGQICAGKKKHRATKDSSVNGKSEDTGKESSEKELELPFWVEGDDSRCDQNNH